MLATHAGRTDCVNLLLRFRANPTITSPDGKTAVIIAQEKGDTQLFNLLLSASQPPTSTHSPRHPNPRSAGPAPPARIVPNSAAVAAFNQPPLPLPQATRPSISTESIYQKHDDADVPLMPIHPPSRPLNGAGHPIQGQLIHRSGSRRVGLQRTNSKHHPQPNLAPVYQAQLGERRGPGDSQQTQAKPRSKVWLWFSRIVTFWAPPFLLESILKTRDRNVHQAWREKISLCFIILAVSAVVGFVTFGLAELVCSPLIPIFRDQLSRDHGFGAPPGRTKLMAVRGRLYDVGDFFQFGGHSVLFQTLNEGERKQLQDVINSEYIGNDATDLFPLPQEISKCLVQPVDDYCKINKDNGDFVRHCHTSDKSRLELAKLAFDQSSDVSWTWVNVTRKGSFLFGYNEQVYSLEAYLNRTSPERRFLAQAPLNITDKDLLPLLGKDATMMINRNSTLKSLLVPCLDTYFRVGRIEGTTIGCSVSNIIQVLATFILVAIILIKFFSAIFFDWFLSRQLGRLRSRHPQSYVIMLVTCYSEDEAGIRTTLDSLSGTTYNDEQKLLFVIQDGNITGSGNSKSTPDIIKGMIEIGDGFPDSPEPYSYVSIGDGPKRHNMAEVYAGFYDCQGRKVPIVFVNKVGSDKERGKPKAGNRGKRDSQLILMTWLSKVTFDERMTPLEFDLSDKVTRLCGFTPDTFNLVLMVDADTLVLPDSLRRMVTAFERDETVMGLCGETRIANKKQSWVSSIQVWDFDFS
ncbi:chitin synthase-domain-containing protein [Paraphysoderma sedebokerense]|nr:chitin synthase-domain-containing protein [Paraphysoderma sedebokerense]KAI9138675.1 chitin synthase-domain-containing protein [Paraphysoderma sedebokerense]